MAPGPRGIIHDPDKPLLISVAVQVPGDFPHRLFVPARSVKSAIFPELDVSVLIQHDEFHARLKSGATANQEGQRACLDGKFIGLQPTGGFITLNGAREFPGAALVSFKGADPPLTLVVGRFSALSCRRVVAMGRLILERYFVRCPTPQVIFLLKVSGKFSSKSYVLGANQ